MTELLQDAFSKAAALSTAEQNALATWLIEEIQSERRWEELFSRSGEELESLAREALEEFREGSTLPLDFEQS